MTDTTKITCAELTQSFKNPGSEYGLAPFWFWNDGLDEAHLLFQLDKMQEQGIEEFLIHARKGLTVPYLSEEWMERVGFVLSECARRGMKCWLYDEENWPSGYAGGRVLAQNPNFCGKYLQRFEGEIVKNGMTVVAFDGTYTYAYGDLAYHPAYSESNYVDMMDKDATRCFIALTHQAYYERFSKYFGSVMLGFFVDEPGFYNNFSMYAPCPDPCSVTWTKGFEREFLARRGYDLLPHLSELFSGDGTRARLDFFLTAQELYCENFLAELKGYCHSVGVKLIGHLHSEEFMPLHVRTQGGDMMRAMQNLDWSGIDRIDLSSEKNTEKYGSSAQHIYNLPETMSETFCFSGWDLSLEKMRRWAGYQFVRGVTKLVPHAFYASIEGDRKWECPPSLFYQTFHYTYFKKFSDFSRRMSLLTKSGIFAPVCALYYPIVTQTLFNAADGYEKATALDKTFIDTANRLLEAQLDFDILNDDAVAAGKIDGSHLNNNGIAYPALVIAAAKTMPLRTLKKIDAWSKAGGLIVFLGDYAEFCAMADEPSEQFEKLKKSIAARNFSSSDGFWRNVPYTYQISAEKLRALFLHKKIVGAVTETFCPELKIMTRRLSDGTLYLMTNESGAVCRQKLSLAKSRFVYRLDPEGGDVFSCPSVTDEEGKNRIEAVLEGGASAAYLCTDRVLDSKEPTVFRAESILYIDTFDTVVFEDGAVLSNVSGGDFAECGKPFYSGRVQYTAELALERKSGKRYFLSAERLMHTAEVYVNGVPAEDIVWTPYRAEVTRFLQDGKNTIRLVVANTLANSLEQKNYTSGIAGVKIECGTTAPLAASVKKK